MAKQIRTKTEYDYAHLEELEWVAATALNPAGTKKRRILLLLLGALSTAGGAAMLAFRLPIPAAVALMVGIPLLFVSLFLNKVRAWSSSRSMGTGKNMLVVEYVTEKNNIIAYVGRDSQRYPYSDCRRLLEAELCFFLFLKDSKGLMLDKAGIQGGTADELRALLEEKCGMPVEWMGRKPR